MYGWVKNVTDDFTSAEPQPQNITASEGEEITLTLFFAKNDPLNGNLYIFEIHTSGSAVGMRHDNPESDIYLKHFL